MKIVSFLLEFVENSSGIRFAQIEGDRTESRVGETSPGPADAHSAHETVRGEQRQPRSHHLTLNLNF